MTDLADLQKNMGVFFKDVSHLELALVHSSFINENPGLDPSSNERLEFLGDAVLGLVVAERLYREYPGCSEGEMTRLRSAVVRQDTLARRAGSIRLGDYLYLGKGEEADGGRQKPANLEAAMEALIAAVFLDGGLATARDFILRLLGEELEEAISLGPTTDYKSALQELTQSRQQITPTYRITKTTGPDHGKTFTVEVTLKGKVIGSGSGKSKKAAETEAARRALDGLSKRFTE